jgi:hypothetical protein
MTNTLLLYGLTALIIAAAAIIYPVTTGLVGIPEPASHPSKGS